METNLVFTDLDTDTSELIGPESYVIDTAVLTDDEREILDGCEMYGAFTGPANEIVRRFGVPFAHLWAAYKREQHRATGDGWKWRADGGGWTHCDDRADYDDDGATCRKCYRFMSHDQAAARMIE